MWVEIISDSYDENEAETPLSTFFPQAPLGVLCHTKIDYSELCWGLYINCSAFISGEKFYKL